MTYYYEEIINYNIFNWIKINNLIINYGIIIDQLSLIIIVPVGIITILVILYSLEYMKYDKSINKFIITLSSFAIFMFILILSNNYLLMFVGWELVGIVSYLLISYWNTRINALKSGLSALLINRIGDTFFIIAICLIINTFNSVDYIIINLLIPYINNNIINTISLMLLIAASAKSAQLGLHSWLLHAMEGPTPVSALLHAATMVCSGIYVLIRNSIILEYSPSILLLILWLGAFTTLVSGIIAIASNDIKRIIALSTMSQLGMMMIAIGISAYNLSIYHLYCHAFFKALLFMSAGSIIHNFISENQDLRKFGINQYLPYTYIGLLISSLSLMAIPGLSGYYSKDIIIEYLYGSYTFSGYIIYFIALISTIFTSLYSLRLIYLTFYNNPLTNKWSFYLIHENFIFSISMFLLIIYSIFIGFYNNNIIYLFNTNINNNYLIDTELSLPDYIKYSPIILCIILSIMLILFYEFYYFKFKSSIYYFFNNKLYFDQLFNYLIRLSLIFSGYVLYFIDYGFFKVFGNAGIFRFLSYSKFNFLFLFNIIYLFFFF